MHKNTMTRDEEKHIEKKTDASSMGKNDLNQKNLGRVREEAGKARDDDL